VIDCGLFSIGVVLHIIDSILITNETFKQEHMTKLLRSELGTHLGAVENLSKYPLLSSEDAFRHCSPWTTRMMAALWFLEYQKMQRNSSTSEVEVIMDGKVSTNDVSANVAESSAAF
jgi:hypothetical protein